MEDKARYEITLLGDSFVGKTCLTKMYVNGTFEREYYPTLDFEQKSVNKRYPLCLGEVKVVINDTSGKALKIIHKLSIERADAIIICYDATNRDSFDNIKTKWYPLIQEYKKKDLILGIVSTKNEFKDLKKVNDEEGLNLAKEYKAIFQKTIIPDKDTVDDIFLRIGRLCLGEEDYIPEKISEEKEIEKPLNKDKNPKKDWKEEIFNPERKNKKCYCCPQ